MSAIYLFIVILIPCIGGALTAVIPWKKRIYMLISGTLLLYQLLETCQVGVGRKRKRLHIFARCGKYTEKDFVLSRPEFGLFAGKNPLYFCCINPSKTVHDFITR